MATIIDQIVAKQLSNSHLMTKSPASVNIKWDHKIIFIKSTLEVKEGGVRKELRSLSDMRLLQLFTLKPRQMTKADKRLAYNRFNRLTYVLENGEIDIYLAKSDYEKDNPQPKHDYKLRRLSTPANVTSFDVSDSTIVTLDRNGLHKLELQERQGLHEIMNSE